MDMEKITTMAADALARPYVRALLAFIVSLIAAKLTQFFMNRVLRWATARTKTRLDDEIVERLQSPTFVSVVLIGLAAATDMLQLPAVYGYFLLGLIKTIAVLIWTAAGIRIVGLLLQGLTRTRRRWVEARAVPLLENVGKLALFSLAIYLLLVAWHLDVKPLLASAGIAGIALGFAAKDTLANIFGGLFIVADAPYKLGNFILLDTGERGRVTKIGLRSTRLLTRDDIEITLPNAQIANSKIVNESGGPYEKARITVTIGVAYGSDIDHVRRVLLEAAGAVEEVVKDPEPRVRFTDFGDSALIFRLLCWIQEPVMRGLALDALNTRVYKMFKVEGIQIPFPQRDVHLKRPA
ncbi:MAG: mechanosensitive ion channel family protein [Acidobacteriota bacterium]